MNFLREILIAFRFYFEAWKFIDKYNFWRHLIVPAISSAIIFSFTIWLAWSTADELLHFAIVKFNLGEPYLYIGAVLEFLIMLMIRGMVFFLYLKVYRYLVLLLLAPEFSFLTGLIQKNATNARHHFHLKRYMHDVWRGIRLASQNFALEIAFTLLAIIAAILVTWIVPFLPMIILLIESYFFGYTMADYRNEYFDHDRKESHQIINEHPGLAIGNGLFFNVILLIPVIGVLFAPVFALTAMGLSVNHIVQHGKFYSSPVRHAL